MDKKRAIQLFVVCVIAISIFSSISYAAPAPIQRISDFFSNNGYQDHDKLIDFFIFFTMFFAMSYIAFSKVWGQGFGKPGDAKGAIIGLSIAIALALAFAIVTQANFSITNLFPIAKIFLLLVLWIIFYGLLSQILGDDKLMKFVAAILGLILAYLALSFATQVVCIGSGNHETGAARLNLADSGRRAGNNLPSRDGVISQPVKSRGVNFGERCPLSMIGYRKRKRKHLR